MFQSPISACIQGFAFITQVVVLSTACAVENPSNAIDLSGDWAFGLDLKDAGIANQWFDVDYGDSIRLPGSAQSQGYGKDVSVNTKWTGKIVDRSWFNAPEYAKYRQPGNVKVPYWLQPDKHYVGVAWYQRTITVPEQWKGKRITLSLERCHWRTTVWVDGKEIGSADSLSTPHRYLMANLEPGSHRLVIRVDNRMIVDVGQNAHSVSDHTQSNWNGIVGKIELLAGDPVWIDDVQVYPDVKNNKVRMKVVFGNLTKGIGSGRMTVQAARGDGKNNHVVAEMSRQVSIERGDRTVVEFDYSMGDNVALWDEFDPALYRIVVRSDVRVQGKKNQSESTTTFGMRRLTTDGTQFVLNGRPIFLRGTLECCIFPKTGYPPTDVDSWKRIIGICKSHGLNHMRFHSWCPPKAAFVAADELGFYFQVECAAWANVDDAALGRFIYAEGDLILRDYGNHPSFIMLAYGNEPDGKKQKRFLGDLVTTWKKKDSRRLYTSAAGWPIIPENQFHCAHAPRIQQWGDGLRSRINARPPETVADYRDFVGQYKVPFVSHEIGQWCAYPNFDEITKYTGVLKAKNFEIFRDTLQENHMGDQAHDFLMASGKLQTLCYKEEIESALRTPGFGGFQLLDLHDFPGQGTALVGVLDPFWDSKPYVSPDEFRRFCNATVPLAKMKKRIWTADELFSVDVEVSHFGPKDLTNQTVKLRLVDAGGRVIHSYQWEDINLPTGCITKVGRLQCDLSSIDGATKLRLCTSISGTPFANDWDIWVYPTNIDTNPPENVLIAHTLNDSAASTLKVGGKVFLLAPPSKVRGNVKIGFSSIFWNTAWTRGQAPHTLGILCDQRHPALASFPTEYHSNWQWSDLIRHSGAMVLNDLPPGVRPIVQPIDTWFKNRRLGLVFEANVGAGKLLVCSIDLQNDLDKRPVARQMRRSLLKYMDSEHFTPEHELTVEQVRGLFKKST